MQEMTQEEKALKLMAEDKNASISWEDVTSELEQHEDELNAQIQRYEQLDIQAQNEALSFYVR